MWKNYEFLIPIGEFNLFYIFYACFELIISNVWNFLSKFNNLVYIHWGFKIIIGIGGGWLGFN